MWDRLPVQNLIDLQRMAAIEQMGQKAKDLLAEGYPVEADKVLDEMIERKRSWTAEANGTE